MPYKSFLFLLPGCNFKYPNIVYMAIGEKYEKMKPCLQNAELHIIKECGHFVHVEKEKEYFDLIEIFLNKK
jgi:pimeloyl-ACP methyl ester carboxylesterase